MRRTRQPVSVLGPPGTRSPESKPRRRFLNFRESDGQPMGETELHREWMQYILDVLRHRYSGQEVYVGCNLFFYYDEHDARKNVVPDDFIVLGCPPGLRRTFKTWIEGKIPNVVFEVTSDSTRDVDTDKKHKTYAKLGIPEYFLYDPTGDYLLPALKGYRLGESGYEALEADSDGRLLSRQLGLLLGLHEGELRFFDAASRSRLLTYAQAQAEAREAEAAARQLEAAARQAEAEARQRETAARIAAEEKAEAALQEVRALRELLRQRGIE